jgi:putative transposase
MRKAVAIELTDGERKTLARWSRSRALPKRQRRAAQILLFAAGGMPNEDIARRLRVSRDTVLRCRTRFLRGGLDRIARKTLRGKREAVTDLVVRTLATELLSGKWANRRHGLRWTTRMLARIAKCSQSTIWRTCQDHGIPLDCAGFVRAVKGRGLILQRVES